MLMFRVYWESFALVLLLTGEVTEAANTLFRCCTPDAWRANVRVLKASVIRGRNTFEEKWVMVNYDKDNQRVSAATTMVNNVLINRREVLDYNKEFRYVIWDDTKCVRHYLGESFRPACTPHNITMVAFAVAPVISPMQGVYANTVYYQTHDVSGDMTVTVGNCAIVAATVYKYPEERVAITQNVQYLNQTLFVDPKSFLIPSGCVHQNDTDIASHMYNTESLWRPFVPYW